MDFKKSTFIVLCLHIIKRGVGREVERGEEVERFFLECPVVIHLGLQAFYQSRYLMTSIVRKCEEMSGGGGGEGTRSGGIVTPKLPQSGES